MTTSSTVDHVEYAPEALTTPAGPVVAQDVPEVDDSRLRALRTDGPLRPDPDARTRIASLIYQITRWETFAYVALGASESEAEADERRRIHRRRRPSWADED